MIVDNSKVVYWRDRSEKFLKNVIFGSLHMNTE